MKSSRHEPRRPVKYIPKIFGSIRTAAIWKSACLLALLSVVSTANTTESNGDTLNADTPERSEIIRDWENQDRIQSRGYRDAIEDIINTLPNLPHRSQLADRLTQHASTPDDSEDLKRLYYRVCSERRKMRMQFYLPKMQQFVYAKCKDPGVLFRDVSSGPGGPLMLVEMNGFYGKGANLRPQWQSRTPEVSYDGKMVLFSSRQNRNGNYHIFEMDLETKNVRRLTDGDCNDIEPIYLPNGNILFNSNRMVQAVDCFSPTVTVNMFLMDADGRYVRRIGFDQSPTNYPHVLSTGEVVYCRWDYNDKTHTYAHGLFYMKPDGTAQRQYYGNNSWWPTCILHPRQIPGSTLLMASITGYHSGQWGKIGTIDNRVGMQNGAGVTLLAPRRLPADDTLCTWGKPKHNYNYSPPEGFDPETFVKKGAWPKDAWCQDDPLMAYPYPFDEDAFIACMQVEGMRGVYFVLSEDGSRELIVEGNATSPVVVAPREVPPQPASKVDYRDSTGIFTITDIYQSQSPVLDGIERGTIKRLRVAALKFDRRNRSRGMTVKGPARINDGGATVHPPIAKGNASWDVKMIVGETPVYEDGSAAFIVPARVPVYFQALDENGRMVQTMRSWSTLQPGETFSCLGCHEDPNSATPISSATIASQKGAQPLEPFYGPMRGFSFTKEIQPILDAHCIQCHNDTTGKLNLLGTPDTDRYRTWSASYNALTNTKKGPNRNHWFSWLCAEASPTLQPPYRVGSARSPFLDSLENGHNDVNLTKEEMDKLSCWIDLGIPFAGDYREGLSDDQIHGMRSILERTDAYEQAERESIAAFIAAGQPSGEVSENGPRRFEPTAPDGLMTGHKGASALIVRDLRGRVVYRTTPENLTAGKLNTKNLPSGCYLVELRTRTGTVVRRLPVTR